MNRLLALALLFAVIACTRSTRRSTGVSASFLQAPSVLAVDGRRVLAFELLVDNGTSAAVRVSGVELAAEPLAGVSLKAAQLAPLWAVLPDFDADVSTDLKADMAKARVKSPPDGPVLPAGRVGAVFLWLELEAGATPARVVARLTLEGAAEPLSAETAVDAEPALVLAPPLAGGPWLAFDSPQNETGHRRVALRFAGRHHIGQRYAVDLGRVGPNGGLVKDGLPETSSAAYWGYGETVYAVAEGKVVQVRDGVPENDGNVKRAPATADGAAGNYVIIELAPKRFGVFAHFQPGSITVKPNDAVRVGTPLGKVGNSGNTTGPHLHFHVCDAPDTLACDGVPFTFSTFAARAFMAAGDSAAEVRFTPQGDATARKGEHVSQTVLLDFGPR